MNFNEVIQHFIVSMLLYDDKINFECEKNNVKNLE
jgi:hypothetical protein